MKSPADDDATEKTDLPLDRARHEPKVARELLPLVYDELRRLTAQRLASEAPG